MAVNESSYVKDNACFPICRSKISKGPLLLTWYDVCVCVCVCGHMCLCFKEFHQGWKDQAMDLNILELPFINRAKGQKANDRWGPKKEKNAMYSFLILRLLNHVWQLDISTFPKWIKVIPGLITKKWKWYLCDHVAVVISLTTTHSKLEGTNPLRIIVGARTFSDSTFCA